LSPASLKQAGRWGQSRATEPLARSLTLAPLRLLHFRPLGRSISIRLRALGYCGQAAMAAAAAQFPAKAIRMGHFVRWLTSRK